MSVDWSKYPPLPKPPKLPEWRDTPEHEAYWEEVEEIRTPLQNKWGCGGMFALWILSAAIFNHWLWGNNWDDIFARIITGGTVGFFAALVPYVICHKIFYWIAKCKISKRYGFSIRKLNRPDISKEIGDVLAERPDFNEADFCKYWQDEDQARAATSVLVSTRNYWCLHKKMLYPNDPLLLLFYGRRWRIFCQWRWGGGKEKMIEPDIEFYLDCVWCYLDVFDRDRFYEESKIFYSKSTTLAEFLEICEEMKKRRQCTNEQLERKNIFAERYRCCVIQLDRMDSAWLLFRMSAVREFMLDDQKKYKSALWISGVLPFVIFSCAMFISEPTFSNVVGRAAYVAVILFAIIFSFYRVKVSKVKVWRGVLEAILIIPLYLLLSLLFFLILFWTIGFGDLSGVQ